LVYLGHDITRMFRCPERPRLFIPEMGSFAGEAETCCSSYPKSQPKTVHYVRQDICKRHDNIHVETRQIVDIITKPTITVSQHIKTTAVAVVAVAAAEAKAASCDAYLPNPLPASPCE
jgi:hypothetical protein